jgi:hypothetical protein
MVLITLYLWIRASDLIFDTPASSMHVRRVRGPHESVRAKSVAAGFEK